MFKNKFYFPIFLLILGGFFILGSQASALIANHLVISEIQVAGATATDEFIEIYNPTDSAVNIENWSIQYKSATGGTFTKKNFNTGAKIPAHGWYLITNSGYTGGTLADMAQTTISLAGTGGNIFLVNNQTILTSVIDSSIVDKVAYGTGNAPEGTAVSAPSAGLSVERKLGGDNGNGEDTDDNLADFFSPATPNPQNTQNDPKPHIDLPPSNNNPIAQAGADQNVFINQTVNLDASSSTDLDSDALSYSWDFGDGSVVEIGVTASHVYSSVGNYTVTLTVTDEHGAQGTDTLSVGVTEDNSNNQFVNASDITLNEFVADPVDGQNEWVELYNKTDQDVLLRGWTIEEGSESITSFDNNATIAAHGFLVVSPIRGYLNNSGDVILLKDQRAVVIDRLAYGNWSDGNSSDNASSTKDPNSVARKIDGEDTDNDLNDWKITTTVTQGLSNVITDPPVVPTGGRTIIALPETLVKNSTTAQPEAPVYSNSIFLSEIYPNPSGSELEEEFIELYNSSDSNVDLAGWKLSDSTDRKYTISAKDFDSTSIVGKSYFIVKRKVSKISLNNSGNEYVRLYQPNGNPVDEIYYSGQAPELQTYAKDLENQWQWTMTITPEKENVFTLPPEKPEAVIDCSTVTLEAGEQINCNGEDSTGESLDYTWQWGDDSFESGLNLIHSYNKIGSYDIILEVSDLYGAKSRAKWHVKVTKPEVESSDENLSEDEVVAKPNIKSAVKKASNKSLSKAKIVTQVITDFNKLPEYSVNDQLTVEGVVTVTPGILGTQIMYIDGLQIYNYKKEFPELKVGDRIKVFGTLALTNGEWRLKTKVAGDITKISSDNQTQPKVVKATDVNEDVDGQLVKIVGKVTDIKGSTVYIDDGEDEVQTYLKKNANVDRSTFIVGQEVEVTGVASITNNGTRILPRSNSDVRRGEVLGASTGLPQDYKVEGKSFWRMFGKYLLVVFIALVAIGASLLIKKRSAK